MLRETVRLWRARPGLAKLGRRDDRRHEVRANTSRHKAMSHGRMRTEEARLEAECAAILQRMDEVHAAEDAEHGEDDDGSGGLPAELQDRERRLAKLRALRKRSWKPERGATARAAASEELRRSRGAHDAGRATAR